jgi:FkbM family methyltransferase
LWTWARYAPRARAALPSYVGARFLAEQKNTICSASGACFAVEPSDIGEYFAMILGGPNYPSHVFEACKLLLTPGGVLYDVGANLGFISIEMGCAHLKDVTIYAFEPQPHLAEKIAVSSALNGIERLQVYDVMLGEENATKALYAPRTSAHASLVPRNSHCAVLSRRMTTLDDLVLSGAISPPSVIKIDVEGAELIVLRGGREVFKKYKPSLVFEADENMKRFGSSKADLFTLIGSFGEYEFYDIVQDRFGRLSGFALIENENADRSKSDDILAVPRGRQICPLSNQV